jgi:membrane-associated protease RseP (regulator of RpoE activity)
MSIISLGQKYVGKARSIGQKAYGVAKTVARKAINTWGTVEGGIAKALPVIEAGAAATGYGAEAVPILESVRQKLVQSQQLRNKAAGLRKQLL